MHTSFFMNGICAYILSFGLPDFVLNSLPIKSHICQLCCKNPSSDMYSCVILSTTTFFLLPMEKYIKKAKRYNPLTQNIIKRRAKRYKSIISRKLNNNYRFVMTKPIDLSTAKPLANTTRKPLAICPIGQNST